MTSIQRQIGMRLKALRQSRKLTLDQLAVQTGFTKSYLSKIETLKKVPPIGSLARICQALGVELATVFQSVGNGQQQDDEVCVVRALERRPAVRGGTTFGYDYEALAHSIPHMHMDPFLFTFPSSIGDEIYFQHEGEEFVFVLSGRVRFVVERREWILSPGDSIFFNSALSHRGEAVGREAKALVVIYSPEPRTDHRPPSLRGDPAGVPRQSAKSGGAILSAQRTQVTHHNKS